MKRKILIVDDNSFNRKLLQQELHSEYDTVTAADGKQALDIIAENYKSISAVLLDIFMPVMDGYSLLQIIRADALFSTLPVIIVTGSEEEKERVKALELGANDFVTKPYNPDIIKHCLRNVIDLRETSSILNAIQKDHLTGLYNREFFFKAVEESIADTDDGLYTIACMDVNNFKLINDQFGNAEGDRVLKHIAKSLESVTNQINGICARIWGDNFACIFPSTPESIDYITGAVSSGLLPEEHKSNFSMSMGLYPICDCSLPVSSLYDRAYIAKQSIKGRFDKHIAYFDDSMLESLQNEQMIIGDMSSALSNREFEVWLQPQFDHSTGALIGSEALVRWRHPKHGLMYPGSFIPVFEQNGFIYELDKYVWDEACRYLRKWLDSDSQVLPISVNVSRFDIFKDDIVEVLTGLIKKYNIPVELLRLEITESAFAKSTEQIIFVVNRLIESGFTVEIDDFGSGYSSLNTLKDVPAQILKLDMRFMEKSSNTLRGGNILESVVRMTKWLDMTVIAEGVETAEQANFLKSIGCLYVQGYLYSKPIPVEEYEKLNKEHKKESQFLKLDTIDNLDNNTFWDPSSMDTLIFNSYVGGACIFEYYRGRIEVLRANDKFLKTIGLPINEVLKIDWSKYLEDKSRDTIINELTNSMKVNDEVSGEFGFAGIPGFDRKLYVRATLRVIASVGERLLIYCLSENITALHEAEESRKAISTQLNAIMDNISGGVTAVVIKDGKPRLQFANKQYYSMFGYTKEQLESEIGDPDNLIFEDDKEDVRKKSVISNVDGESFTLLYRAVKRDKSIIWVMANISNIRISGIDEIVQLSVTNDITEMRKLEQKEHETSSQLKAIMEHVNCGVTAVIVKGNEQKFLFANPRYYDIFGTKEGKNNDVSDYYSVIVSEDKAAARAGVISAFRSREQTIIEFRINHPERGIVWVRCDMNVSEMYGIELPVLLTIYSDITIEKNADLQLMTLNDMAHDMLALQNADECIANAVNKLKEFFDGDRAYICEIASDGSSVVNSYEVSNEDVSLNSNFVTDSAVKLISVWEKTFDDIGYVFINDIDIDRYSGIEKIVFEKQNVKSLVAVPIVMLGKCIGFIGVDNPKRNHSNVCQVRAIGDYIAVLIMRRNNISENA